MSAREAAKLVLLRPGDVYFFSGGTAHTAMATAGPQGGAGSRGRAPAARGSLRVRGHGSQQLRPASQGYHYASHASLCLPSTCRISPFLLSSTAASACRPAIAAAHAGNWLSIRKSNSLHAFASGGRLEGAMPVDEFEEILEEALLGDLWGGGRAAGKRRQPANAGPVCIVMENRKADPVCKGWPQQPKPPFACLFGCLGWVVSALKSPLPPLLARQLWRTLRQELLADQAATMRLLQEHWAATVAQCLARSRFLRQQCSATVRRAQRRLQQGRGFAAREDSRSSSPQGDRAVRKRSRSPLRQGTVSN
ncbi:Slc47a1 [Symbiodinium sp. CCMP2592]|nr:Slc47a1 [Symbiodinium sp. CCMP2592]